MDETYRPACPHCNRVHIGPAYTNEERRHPRRHPLGGQHICRACGQPFSVSAATQWRPERL